MSLYDPPCKKSNFWHHWFGLATCVARKSPFSSSIPSISVYHLSKRTLFAVKKALNSMKKGYNIRFRHRRIISCRKNGYLEKKFLTIFGPPGGLRLSPGPPPYLGPQVEIQKSLRCPLIVSPEGSLAQILSNLAQWFAL